jgi:hypothetical protein
LNDATFDEELTIMIKIKLIQPRQLILQSCSANQQVDIAVGTPPNTVP